MEEWKDIKGYEGYYQVSNLGNVKSLEREIKNHSGYVKTVKGITLKQSMHPDGYMLLGLRKNNIPENKRAHRLVAEAFIPNPKKKRCVNHINGIKHDNTVANLEWCTYKENMEHAFKMGLSVPHNTSKVTAMYDLNNNFIKKFKSQSEAVLWLKNNGWPKACSSAISEASSGIIKTCYKYIWKTEK